jgi:IS30 family transposase
MVWNLLHMRRLPRVLERLSILLDQYSSWQKGAIENINGLIRQYIPKSTTFERISQQQITKIMEKINNRPRAKLNFSTPKECFMKNIN